MIRGYIEIDNERRHFFFDQWELNILPNKTSEVSDIFQASLKHYSDNKSKFGTKYIEGITYDNQHIRLEVTEYSVYSEAIIKHQVISYILSARKDCYEKISHLRIYGDVVDIFYPSNQTYDYSNLLNGESTSIKYEVMLKSSDIINFQLEDKIKTTIQFNTSIKTHVKEKTLLSSYSFMSIDFSVPIDYSLVFYVVDNLKTFFSIINHNKSIVFDKIEICERDENSRVSKCGLALSKMISSQSHIGIRFSNVNFNDFAKELESLSKLLSEVFSDKMNFNYIPRDNFERNSYSSRRFIEVIAAFEKNFKIAFPLYEKSKFKVNAMKEVNTYIENRINELEMNCKQRNAYISLIDYVDNYDPLISKIAYLRKKDTVFNEIITNIYGVKLTEDVKLNDRLNSIRNMIAHGETNIDFEENDFFRFKFISFCVYYLSFKSVQFSNESLKRILKKINDRI